MSAFKEADGFMPKAVSRYVLDAELVAIIKEYYFDAVTVVSDENGIYRCVKCSFHADFDGLMAKYAEFRERYKQRGVRLTLEEQRKL